MQGAVQGGDVSLPAGYRTAWVLLRLEAHAVRQHEPPIFAKPLQDAGLRVRLLHNPVSLLTLRYFCLDGVFGEAVVLICRNVNC